MVCSEGLISIRIQEAWLKRVLLEKSAALGKWFHLSEPVSLYVKWDY